MQTLSAASESTDNPPLRPHRLFRSPDRALSPPPMHSRLRPLPPPHPPGLPRQLPPPTGPAPATPRTPRRTQARCHHQQDHIPAGQTSRRRRLMTSLRVPRPSDPAPTPPRPRPIDPANARASTTSPTTTASISSPISSPPLPASASTLPHTPLLGPNTQPSLEKELLSELSCEICFMLLYNPVTTPCQHTFCAKCLHRSLDHSNVCPLCRDNLPGFSFFEDHPPNETLETLLVTAFPEMYAERGDALAAEERDARLDTPIFVCALVFPGHPTALHFFEPRYRLMLRRCLEQRVPAFGMVMPARQGAGAGVVAAQPDYGTMLEVRSVQMLADGRSMVETWSTFRFRILERGTLDWLHRRPHRAHRRLSPTPPSSPPLPPTPSSCRYAPPFSTSLRRGTAPWVVQRLNNVYGAPPTDPAAFAYWVALVLPID
ncbi:PUA-like domain-containing protein [Mycena galericulata]|nr:PUA-like domain-containing protein [Mycena galericulata]